MDTRPKNDCQKIQCGISQAFDEGNLKPGFDTRAYGNSFEQTETAIDELAAHILDGSAWIPGQFEGETRKNETFICTIALGVDFDHTVSVADLLAIPFVHQHAAIIHPTKSSRIVTEKNPDGGHRSRLIFVLDNPIHGVEATRAIIRAIADHIGLEYDPASYKPAQLFYGSRNTVEIPHINRFAVLPLELAAGLTADLAREDYRRYQDNLIKQQNRKPVDLNSTRAEKYAAATYDAILRTIASAPDGAKNNVLFKGACDAFAIADWPGMSVGKIEADLESIYGAWPNDHKSRGTVASAKRTATPRPLELDEQPTPQHPRQIDPKPAPAINADLILNERYVSERLVDLPMSGVIAIISGTGTGKTELSRRATQPDESRITISPLRMLTRNTAERNDDEYYEDVPGAHTRALIKRLSICLKSIEPFAALPADQFPHYDVVCVDELSKILEQLDSELFKDGEAARTFAVLIQLMKNAKRVYVTDAYMGEIEINLLKSIRPDVFTVVNTYQHNYGHMVIYPTPTIEPILGEIEKSIAANKGTVAIQTNRQSEAEKLAEYFGTLYGREAVVSIHSGNSTNLLQRNFLTTITKSNTTEERAAAAAALDKYNAVIASPSLLTGVDIQPSVYRLFGIFYSQHVDQIDAAGCMQMLARYRNPQETHVWVGQGERKLETNPKAIYDHYREAAQGTAILCNLSVDGLDFDGINKELLKLQSAIKARRNRSLNALYTDFVSMAQHNYTVQNSEADLPNGNINGLFEANEAIKARLKADTLNPALEPITPDMHRDKSKRGIRTDQDNAALLKYRIERTYRQPVTEKTYDLFDDGKGQAELFTYIDVWHTTEKELKARDTHELIDGTPYTALKHRTARARTHRKLLLAVWGSRKRCTPEHTLTHEHIQTAMRAFISESGRDLALYCGNRADYSEDGVRILQQSMRKQGLLLRKDREPAIEGAAKAEYSALSDQLRAKKISLKQLKKTEDIDSPALKALQQEITQLKTHLESWSTYRLEADSLELMASLAKIRMDAIAQDEIERQTENQNIRFYGKNLQKSVVYTKQARIFVKNAGQSDAQKSPTHRKPPGNGWRPAPAPHPSPPPERDLTNFMATFT